MSSAEDVRNNEEPSSFVRSNANENKKDPLNSKRNLTMEKNRISMKTMSLSDGVLSAVGDVTKSSAAISASGCLQDDSQQPTMIKGRAPYSAAKLASTFTPPKNWANAPEFIPKSFSGASSCASESELGAARKPDAALSKTYASVVGDALVETSPAELEELCPYAMVGECRYGDQCLLLHGNLCDLCGQFCLHPYDPVQRERHAKECVKQHEQNMELSFAIARSSDKSCGICMEVVMEKSPAGEQRFGILPSCNHCYCLSCLRKWRQARQFENKICRSCPECRVTSDFICPSRFWVEGKDEKEKLISSYKMALSKKPCRYYKSGSGECPFGNKCFYLHALPNGTKVDVGPPRRKPKRIQIDGQEVSAGPGSSIWDFLYDWELQWLDVEEFMDMFSSDFEDESDEDDDLHDINQFYL